MGTERSYILSDISYSEWKERVVENEADVKRVISKMKNVSDVLTRNKPPVNTYVQ